jgi:hypothetical protein
MLNTPFKPRTKLTLILGTKKRIFSGNKRDTQIEILADNTEIRVNKLEGAFRFKATGFKPEELTFDQIREKEFKIILSKK